MVSVRDSEELTAAHHQNASVSHFSDARRAASVVTATALVTSSSRLVESRDYCLSLVDKVLRQSGSGRDVAQLSRISLEARNELTANRGTGAALASGSTHGVPLDSGVLARSHLWVDRLNHGLMDLPYPRAGGIWQWIRGSVGPSNRLSPSGSLLCITSDRPCSCAPYWRVAPRSMSTDSAVMRAVPRIARLLPRW